MDLNLVFCECPSLTSEFETFSDYNFHQIGPHLDQKELLSEAKRIPIIMDFLSF